MADVSSSFPTSFFSYPLFFLWQMPQEWVLLLFYQQDPSRAQLFYIQLDHIPFPLPLESLVLALPFPCYFLSLSAPHLPSPNLKPIQHITSLNSAIATSPPCWWALLQMPTHSQAAALSGQTFMCSWWLGSAFPPNGKSQPLGHCSVCPLSSQLPFHPAPSVWKGYQQSWGGL